MSRGNRVNVKEAAQVVDNPPPINWEWLAGFFQAEGSPSADYNRNLPELIIPQNSPEVLDDIETFIKSVLNIKINRSHYTTKSNLVEGEFENYRLIIWSRINVVPVIRQIYPYLRSKKRTQVQLWSERLGIPLPTNTFPLSWDFIAGFYEGDGYPRYADLNKMKSVAVELCFPQNDPQLLNELQEFFGRGFTANHRKCPEFRVRDGVRTGRKLSWKLLEHLHTRKCRMKLVVSLL